MGQGAKIAFVISMAVNRIEPLRKVTKNFSAKKYYLPVFSLKSLFFR